MVSQRLIAKKRLAKSDATTVGTFGASKHQNGGGKRKINTESTIKPL